jgi:hypothetical protein
MNFLIFLWNSFARLFWFLSFIVFEVIVFRWLIGEIDKAGLPGLSLILSIIFVIWIVAEIILRIVVGGGTNLIKWILRI